MIETTLVKNEFKANISDVQAAQTIFRQNRKRGL